MRAAARTRLMQARHVVRDMKALPPAPGVCVERGNGTMGPKSNAEESKHSLQEVGEEGGMGN